MIFHSLWPRIALAVSALAIGAATIPAHAQSEIIYASNLDPNNKTDPRAAAQTRIIEAFERANPVIKVKVLVDPTQASYLRALKSKSTTPDVIKVIGYGAPEYVATGSLSPLEDLVKRDAVSETDWLIPLSSTKVNGRLYGLPLDYRIPIFIYRKSALTDVSARPPRTWAEVCGLSKALTKANKIGYAVPLGTSGGLGGAQAFAELMFSSMATEGTGKYFDDEGRNFLATKDQVVKAATTIRDLFKACGVPTTSLQFGYNEVHDGLRAGTVSSATFGLYRFGAIVAGGAADDLAWAPPPAFEPDGKQVVYGYMAALNANSAQKEAAWKFVKFLGSPEAQSIAAEGGEVVARTSANAGAAYFETPAGQRQKEWAKLVAERGFLPSYPLSLTLFNQVMGEALQRMVLRGSSPEEAYDEIKKRYGDGMAQTR